jgi:hypothetical protein
MHTMAYKWFWTGLGGGQELEREYQTINFRLIFNLFRREHSASITLFVHWSIGPHGEILGYIEIASPQDSRACFGSPLFLSLSQNEQTSSHTARPSLYL